jgi:hypothetical protein
MSNVTPLKEVQNNFALIELAGQFYILNRDQINQLVHGESYIAISYYKEKEGKLKIKRFIEEASLGLEDKEVTSLLINFMKSTNTLLYTSVAFDPRPQPPNVLNLWRPHAIEAKEGSCDIILDFIFDIICNKDSASYHFIISYLAHMLQKPEQKPMVAVILLGGQGVGKGAFYTILKATWRHTMRQVHSIDDVVGTFTASALEGSLAIWMDEALFNGDKKSMDRLKALISEDEVTIEEKYQPKRNMRSIHRLFGASNHEHFAHIEKDDRRFFFLNVSEAWKQDDTKFSPLFRSFEDGKTIPAFVGYLLGRNIEDFKPFRDRPKTSEHAKQKIHSLEGLDRFLYEALQAAEVDIPNYYGGSKIWNGSLVISTKDLKEAYSEYDKTAQRYRPISESKMKPDLLKIFPSAETTRFTENHNNKRGISFGSIQQSRTDFDHYIGCEVDWDELP